MKKILTLFCFIGVFSTMFGQVATIHDPTLKVTATPQAPVSNPSNRIKSSSAVIDLSFEGLGDMANVGNYYNGGAGGDYGITWSPNSLSLISADAGGSGNFCGNSTPPTCLFFVGGVGASMTKADGFDTGFSFYYCSAAPITITVYDGLDGTGNVLTTQVFPANFNTTAGPQYTCNCAFTFCHWDAVGVAFAGTAKSVTFGGAANQCGFDNVVLGASSHCPPIPDAGPITGPVSVCPNSTGHVYSIEPLENATEYVWTLPAGATIVGGAGTNSVTVSFTTNSGQITVKGISDCTEGAPSTLDVTVFPVLNPGAVTANQTICYNTMPAGLSVTNPTGGIAPYNHQWQYSYDNVVFTNINGATSRSYQPGNLIRTTYYRVQQGSSTGCATVPTGSVMVEVLPPMYAVEIVGNQTICENDAPVELVSLPADEGPIVYLYQWQVSDDDFDYADIPDATGTTYQPGTLNKTQYYRLKKISPLGCGVVYSDPVVVRVNHFPVKPGQITGPVSGYIPGKPATYSVNPVAHATGYEWVLPFGTIVHSGANTNQITVTFPSKLITGKIYVRGVNACGVGSYSSNFVISVNNAPDEPGTTSLDLDELSGTPSLTVYPVPNDGRFTLDLAWGHESQVNIEILTLTGAQVAARKVQTQEGTITESFDVSAQPAGIYLIRAYDHQKSTNVKVVISK